MKSALLDEKKMTNSNIVKYDNLKLLFYFKM